MHVGSLWGLTVETSSGAGNDGIGALGRWGVGLGPYFVGGLRSHE